MGEESEWEEIPKMRFSTVTEAFDHIGPSFSLAPFAEILQPLIDEVLVEQGQDRFRRGTLLMPKVLIWLVLALTIRRDLNCQKVLNWMLSGFRWLNGLLPAQSRLVAEGTISHARVKLGSDLFRRLFARLTASGQEFSADFHGRMSVIFDGSTGTMPDSEANKKNFIRRPPDGERPLFPSCGWFVW